MDLNQLVLWDDIIGNVDNAVELFDIQREVLPHRDPFSLSEEKFIKTFRLTKRVCEDVIAMVAPYIQEASRRSALTVQTKVLAALRFFGYGSYQEITSTNHYIGISQASMSRCIREVCDALNQPVILNEWIRFPTTVEDMQILRSSFYQRYQFPGIIGCVDCTHVSIIAPPVNDPQYPEHVYVNRKNYHSINVQLICDSSLRIMNVNAQFPGSTHDAHIWQHSGVSRMMEAVYRHDPHNIFFLIGDSGYPTRPWLLTPINNPNPGPEQMFNERFCNIRSTIERCNGLLKNRFRCLLKHRTLHYSPTMAGKIINSCVVLHNICLANNIANPEPAPIENIDYGIYAIDNFQNHIGRINPDLAAARQLQQNIVNTHFV